MLKIGDRMFPWTETLAARNDAEEIWAAPKRIDVGPLKDWFKFTATPDKKPGPGWVKNKCGYWKLRPPKVKKKSRGMRGKHHTRETKNRIALTLKGRERTPEHNLKISISMKKTLASKREAQSNESSGNYQLHQIPTG